jgi:hypothetical protein
MRKSCTRSGAKDSCYRKANDALYEEFRLASELHEARASA